MRSLTLSQFEEDAESFDRAVDATPGIDRFCSGTDWILPQRAAWGAELEPWFRVGDAGHAAFLRHDDTLFGFDFMWQFACPLVGADPAEFVEPCLEAATVVVVPGVVADASWWRRVANGFERRARLVAGQTARRWVVRLNDGVEGFLARRAAKFRENLRRAQRKARDERVEFLHDPDDDVDTLFARIAALERRSWKAGAATGLLSPDVHDFYLDMGRRLAARGALRVTFAQQDGVDVGYLLGAVRADQFRGLQKSYDDAFAHLSLGHLMQLARLRELEAHEPEVTRYDLGMDMEYKRQWGDEIFETVTLAAIRR